MRPLFGFVLLLALTCCVSQTQASAPPRVPQWSVYELSFTARDSHANAYTEIALQAVFTGPGSVRQTCLGFWDGGQVFKIRFTPTIPGQWTYRTESNDAGLSGQTGTLQCIAPRLGDQQPRGFLRRDAAYPYHFIFDDGTRYFMFGQTYYSLLRNALAGDNWKAAVTNTRRTGMNKVRLRVFDADTPSAADPYPAASPFVRSDTALDRDQLNLSYWRKLDEVVRFMAAQDMLADLILFWSTPQSYGTPQQDRRFASYAVARYAAFPNVMWCVTNEWNYTKKPRDLFVELGKLIQAQDPWAVDVRRGRQAYVRALSVHQQTRHDFQFFDQSWLSHAIVQLGVRNQGKTFRDGNEWDATQAAEEGRTFRHGDEWGNYSIVFNYGHRLPVVNDEYGYIGEPSDQSVPKDADGKYPSFSRTKHRQTIWGIYAGGGYAAAGDKTTYADGRPYFSTNWHDTAEYGDIRRLIEFFTTKGLAYWRMSPQNDLLKSGARVYVLAEKGRQYVMYAAVGGSFTVDLAAGNYTAYQFDPRTGAEVNLGVIKGGRQTFDLAQNEDWVIRLQSVAAPRATNTAALPRTMGQP